MLSIFPEIRGSSQTGRLRLVVPDLFRGINGFGHEHCNVTVCMWANNIILNMAGPSKKTPQLFMDNSFFLSRVDSIS
jgi:hypothetical protein